jgi:hypothetical protein
LVVLVFFIVIRKAGRKVLMLLLKPRFGSGRWKGRWVVSDKCEMKIGTVMPDEYDWREQMRELCKDIIFEGTLDTGKVWGICVAYDRLTAENAALQSQLGRLVEASLLRKKHKHNDTCQAMLVDDVPCNCGWDKVKTVLAEIQGGRVMIEDKDSMKKWHELCGGPNAENIPEDVKDNLVKVTMSGPHPTQYLQAENATLKERIAELEEIKHASEAVVKIRELRARAFELRQALDLEMMERGLLTADRDRYKDALEEIAKEPSNWQRDRLINIATSALKED